jgi:F-type H+-transporting ATPase subunit a
MIFGIICLVLGVFGLLEVTGILSGVPILAYGLPAVLSCYFDLFSGFVQAYVFTLLTMVYISGSLPEPEEAAAA